LKYLAVLIILLSVSGRIYAQSVADTTAHAADSAKISDSVKQQKLCDSLQQVQRVKDSLLAKAQEQITIQRDSLLRVFAERRKQALATFQDVLRDHPYFKFYNKPERQLISLKLKESSDGIFYYFIALVLYIALMRLFFYKYMSTMFTVFFRATLRQQQLREQLLQAPLPALLMNIFFVVSVATYCTFLAMHFELPFAQNFWTALLYAIGIIASIYVVKFIFLNIVGWIFGISNVTDTYIFIVFLINKMIGIFLLPLIALLAFPTARLFPVMLTLSYILVGGMLFYRFIISFRPVRNEIKLNRLHFFLYLCAFEIAPLLLIYKVLLAFVDQST
jgi:hypothetical protein